MLDRLPIVDRDALTTAGLALLLVLSLAVSLPQWNLLQAQGRRVERQRAEARKLQGARAPGVEAVRAALPASANEPAAFMAELLAAARASGCEMGGYTVLPSPAPSAPLSGKESAPIVTVRTQVSLGCDYPHLRQLVDRLEHFRRRYVIADVSAQIRPNAPNANGGATLEVNLMIDRYVISGSSAMTARPR